MATFAKSTFNASVYSSFRPTYPQQLFNNIFEYHARSNNSRQDLAVDIGCGTGQATPQLRHFGQVIGVDPSLPMVTAAQRTSTIPNIKYVQGHAENLKGIVEPDSVDLLISAQAAHWFDWGKVWPETRRVLRTGGTVAFWIYSEFRLTGYPSVTPRITQYAQGTDPKTSLGPHFQRPGRTILENLLLDVPAPTEVPGVSVSGSEGGLGDFQRVFYSGAHHPDLPHSSIIKPVEMRTTMRWRDLLGYFRTWSPLHTFHELFPDDLHVVDERFPEDLESNEEGKEDIDVRGGDIAVRFWKDLRQGVKDAGGAHGVDESVSVEWPIALLLARKV
ncbi:S-adenosyl-L-methionine-dependent methyltransferase [Collybia nuda]|uniref:S-adenosyl-L-methionine-dependent methyltransferase n=1 Tax=Collybia nuda TaxID=64659 RepID=A0A9P5XU82_9AGAR|nr:S-adenosyl-L-methionine-dependent methyltransferase [Collybia nuda]